MAGMDGRPEYHRHTMLHRQDSRTDKKTGQADNLHITTIDIGLQRQAEAILERWHRDKEVFSENVQICGAAALAVVFASGVGLICIQHYMYRSLHYAGVGVIAGGVVCGIASVVMYIQQMGAHQEGMSSSAEIYVRGVLESGLLSAFCAVGLGILLMIAGSLAGRMRNKQVTKIAQ